MTPQQHYDKAERLLSILADLRSEVEGVRTRDDVAVANMVVGWYSARIQAHLAAAQAGFTRDATGKPKVGDRVLDGGEWGVLARCPECNGDGVLHRPDSLPPSVQSLDDTADMVRPA